MIKQNPEIYPWSKMSDLDIDELMRTKLTREEKIDYLELMKPTELDKFFKEEEIENN